MSAPERAAIDISPAAPPRPTLALVLAVLAVPGSTVAWELPLGGLWIGLPLAVGAIILGRRARREEAGTGRATAAIVVAGLCILQMAVWTAVSAADGSEAGAEGTTLTFKELDEGGSFTHIRNTDGPKRANLQGDIIAQVSRITDESDTPIGRSHLACVTTKGARNFLMSKMTCTGVVKLPDGTVTGEFVNSLAPTVTGAITGGTGAYAGASGEFVSEHTDYGSLVTVTLGD